MKKVNLCDFDSDLNVIINKKLNCLETILFFPSELSSVLLDTFPFLLWKVKDKLHTHYE